MKKSILLLMLIVIGITLTACDTDELDTVIDNTLTSITEDVEDNYTEDEIEATLDEVLVAMDDVNIDFDSFEYDDTEYQSITATNETVEITTGGYYLLEGEYRQIIINTPEEDVDLILNGVNIAAVDGPAILVLDGDDVTLSVVEGTTNTISDSGLYLTSYGEELEVNSTIMSYVDLEINGTGTLTVEGNYNNAITTKDDLKISEVTLYVESVDDGIVGRDYVAIDGANISIYAEGDGIKSTNAEAVDKGFVYILSGNVNIESYQDGIEAVNSVIVYEGTITIDSFDNAIQSDSSMYIGGGVLDLVAGADGLSATTELYIFSGEITIDADDDGIHSDDSITIDGGSILIENSYEGIEAYQIYINGGNIAVNSTDDGINGTTGGGQEHGTTYVSTGGFLEITGGVVQVNAVTGDGIDVNGSISMSGGFVVVYGTSADNQGAMDYDDEFSMSGGTLITLGSTGMIQAPSTSSSQPSILYGDTESMSSGDTVTLYDEAGTVLLEITGIRSFTGVVISTEDLVIGNSYTLEVGSNSYDFEINSSVTNLGDGGSTMGDPGIGPGRR